MGRHAHLKSERDSLSVKCFVFKSSFAEFRRKTCPVVINMLAVLVGLRFYVLSMDKRSIYSFDEFCDLRVFVVTIQGYYLLMLALMLKFRALPNPDIKVQISSIEW